MFTKSLYFNYIIKNQSINQYLFHLLFQIQACKNDKNVFSPSLFDQKQPPNQKYIQQDIYYEEPRQQMRPQQNQQYLNQNQNQNMYQIDQNNQRQHQQEESTTQEDEESSAYAYQRYYQYQKQKELKQKLLPVKYQQNTNTNQNNNQQQDDQRPQMTQQQVEADAYQQYYQYASQKQQQQRQQYLRDSGYDDLQASSSNNQPQPYTPYKPTSYPPSIYVDQNNNQRGYNQQYNHQYGQHNDQHYNNQPQGSTLENADLSILDNLDDSQGKVYSFDELVQTNFTSKKLQETIKSIILSNSFENIDNEKMVRSSSCSKFSIVTKSQQFVYDGSDNGRAMSKDILQKDKNRTTNLNSIDSLQDSYNIDLYEQQLDNTINQQAELERKRKSQSKAPIKRSSLFNKLNQADRETLLQLLQKSDVEGQFDESNTEQQIFEHFSEQMILFNKRTQLQDIDQSIFTFLIIQQKIKDDYDYKQLLKKISVLKSIKQDSPYYKRTKSEVNNLKTTLKKRYQNIVTQLNQKELNNKLNMDGHGINDDVSGNRNNQRDNDRYNDNKYDNRRNDKQERQQKHQRKDSNAYELDDQWTQKSYNQKSRDQSALEQFKAVNGFY